jgi:hypothetical protein
MKSNLTYTVRQIAEKFRVNTSKVCQWIADRHLIAVNVAQTSKGERPRWRITEEALEAFEKSRSTSPAPVKMTRARRKMAEKVPEYVS